MLGFLTFLAAVNVFNAVMHGADKTADDTINLHLISRRLEECQLV